MSCHEVLSLEDFQPAVKSEEAQFSVPKSLEKEAVETAGMDSEEFQYSTDGEENVFQVGVGLPIEDGQQYYWRVDSQRGGNVFKGDVWMFRT